MVNDKNNLWFLGSTSTTRNRNGCCTLLVDQIVPYFWICWRLYAEAAARSNEKWQSGIKKTKIKWGRKCLEKHWGSQKVDCRCPHFKQEILPWLISLWFGEQTKKEKADEAAQKSQKRLQKLTKRIDVIKHIWLLRGNKCEDTGFGNWNMSKLRTYLQYKKDPKDPAMPKTLTQLQCHCLKVSGRNSPLIKTNGFDNEDEHLDNFDSPNINKAMDV